MLEAEHAGQRDGDFLGDLANATGSERAASA